MMKMMKNFCDLLQTVVDFMGQTIADNLPRVAIAKKTHVHLNESQWLETRANTVAMVLSSQPTLVHLQCIRLQT